MNFSDYESLESLMDFESDETDESDESDESSDEILASDEARRRGRRPFRPKVPSGRNLYKPRPQGNYVTQVQLKSALDRVGGQIKTTAEATKALSARVNTAIDRLDKEAATRRKQDANINQQIQKSRESALLPLLLQRPPTPITRKISVITLDENGDPSDEPQDVDVVTGVKQSSDNMLPLLLIMGMGGGGGGGTGGDDNSMMMLALLMSQGGK